jgi:hypothetical protein
VSTPLRSAIGWVRVVPWLGLLSFGCQPAGHPDCPPDSVRVGDGTCVRTAMYQYAQCVYTMGQAGLGPSPSHYDYCYSLATGVPLAPRGSNAPAPVLTTPSYDAARPSTTRCEIPIDFVSQPVGVSARGACAGLVAGRSAAVRVTGVSVVPAAQLLSDRVTWQLGSLGRAASTGEAPSGTASVELVIPSVTVPSSGVVPAELRLEFCPGPPGVSSSCGLANGVMVIEEIDPMNPVLRREPPERGRSVGEKL